jgi:hypothetical protein
MFIIMTLLKNVNSGYQNIRAFSKYESPAKQASDSRPGAGEKEDFGVLAGGFATGQHPKPRL